MDNALATGAMLSVAIVVLACCMACWTAALARISVGRSPISWESRKPVPWNGAMVAGAFLLYLGFSVLAVLTGLLPAFQLQDEATRLAIQLTATGLCVLASTLVTILMLQALSGADRIDLGFSGSRLISDTLLGGMVFVAVAPPIYLLQALLSQVDDTPHPLVTLLQEHGGTWLFAAALFAAVLAAPIVEEFLFRVVLQGWLEKKIGGIAPEVPLEESPAESPLPVSYPQPGPSDQAEHNPFASPAVRGLDPISSDADEISPGNAGHTLPVTGLVGFLPILISSFVFALFHLGHGLAPVSLFFLALALGYLYRQTHRIWPCIVVHLLLNGTSMTMLWLILRFDLAAAP